MGRWRQKERVAQFSDDPHEVKQEEIKLGFPVHAIQLALYIVYMTTVKLTL
jgi:hypothetical protein